MKMRFIWVLCLILGCCGIGNAQYKANYQLAEKFREFALGGKMTKNSLSIHPKFIHRTDAFWFDFQTENGREYYLVNPSKKSKELLFDREKLAMGLSEYTKEVVDGKTLNFYDLDVSKDLRYVVFSFKGREYKYDRYSCKMCQLPLEEEEEGRIMYSHLKWSPDDRYVLYARNHNLYIRGNGDMGVDTAEICLTTDGVRYYSYAVDDEAEPSNQAVSANARWSADSKYIYLVRGDTRQVEDMYLVNTLSKRPSLITYRYEMPGDKHLCQYELWCINVETRKVVKMKADKWQDQYIAVLKLSEKGNRIYFERSKRTWDEVDVCVADMETGEVRELIHEEDRPYRDVHMKSTIILNNGKDILFRSERTGWGHYYHYDGDGNLKNVITSGPWVAGHVVEIDTINRKLWLYGHGKEKNVDPYYYLLYEADMDKEGTTLLSAENAQHSVIFSPSRRFYIDQYSRVDMEPRIVLKNAKGKEVMELAQVDLRRVQEEGWRKPERFCVKAADGITDLYGVMWKPADFDSTRCYPIISSVYPGPYFEYVNTSFALNDAYNTRLAQLGFIVITVGHRGGSPMRGKAYHRYGYGNMRDYALEDDKCAIEQLAARHSFIDITKVGIFGHSGGGFMAAAALCKYPDFYTAAVASAGNHDNRIYNRGWVEIYHGVKEKSRKVKTAGGQDSIVYEYSCKVPTNMELAANLKGHLLLVAGDQDANVHPAHLMRFADALIKAGKNFDMVLLPGAKHGYTGANERFYEKKLWNHFARYLLNDAEAGNCVDLKDLK